ncbi:redoxin domain-containing protein, partial [Mucilaginibacter sp. 5B2]|nr:redoxin domain-containing protein [Mucilaginibacter sp. 5B2]
MATELKAGDKAPNFTANDQNGAPVSLGDFKGKKVILYFYPKDDTPGCTAESCSFRDNY